MVYNLHTIILLILLIPSVCFGAPSVSGVTGTVSDGNQITVSGSGFGTTGPTIVVFDDFESGTNGVRIATDGPETGTWTLGSADNQYYSNTQALSGNLSFMVANSGGDPDPTESELRTSWSSNAEFFIVYNMYIPSDDVWPGYDTINETNWKLIWFHSGWKSACESDTDIDVVIAGDNESESRGAPVSGNCPGLINGTYCSFYKGRWNRQALYIYADNEIPDSKVCGYMMVRGINTNTYFDTDDDAEPEPSIHPTYRDNDPISHTYNQCEINAYQRPNSGYTTNTYMDDIYIAAGSGCRARVEIGDQDTYTSCTNLTICTVDSWSASSVVATVRAGSFTSGTAYVFVVDADGAVSSGYEITFGSGSSPAVSNNGVSGNGVGNNGGG